MRHQQRWLRSKSGKIVEVITRLYDELAQSYIAQPFTTFFEAVCMQLIFSEGKITEKRLIYFHHAAQNDGEQNNTGNDPVKSKSPEAIDL